MERNKHTFGKIQWFKVLGISMIFTGLGWLIEFSFIWKGIQAVTKFRRGIQQRSFFFFRQGIRTAFPGTFMKQMTKREAFLILQIPRSATIKQIKMRHKKMMIINHPDHGGSTFLATKINEAKELLTGQD